MTVTISGTREEPSHITKDLTGHTKQFGADGNLSNALEQVPK